MSSFHPPSFPATPSDAPTRGEVSTPEARSVFVGREREMEELVGALQDAAAGQGRLYLIGGEPGIGKSRLAAELGGYARRHGAEVLWGRAWEDAGAPAYWPWIQLFRTHLRTTDTTVIRRQLGGGAGDLAQLLPEIASVVGDLAPPTSTDPASARFRLFDSATSFVVAAAADAPVLLVLDDLHAADVASVLLLRFLASQLQTSRILVLGTYRDTELAPDHPLGAALDELGREPVTRLLLLRGLSEAAVGTLVETALGSRRHLRFISRLRRATAGNPLFLAEAVRAVREGGHDADAMPTRLAVPASISVALATRIARLGAACAAMLRDAAALGPEFDAETLRAVTGQGAEAFEDARDQALDAGLIASTALGLSRLRFSHDLVREVLYAELPRGGRLALHRRIAEILERRWTDSLADHAAELAHHFVEGEGSEHADRAVAYARLAGDQAAGSLAYEEAARLYGMALEALDRSRRAVGSERAELLLALGDSEARAGDDDAARTTFLAAADAARAIGSGASRARAALGYGGRFIWSRVGADPHLVELLQDALATIGDTDERLAIRLRARLACAWRSEPEHFTDCDALTAEALSRARTLGDPETLCYALVGRWWATFWPDNPERRLEIARELLAVAVRAGDAERVLDAHQALHVAHLELGRMAEARGDLAAAHRAAAEMRQPTQQWALRAYDAVIALLEGAYDRASALVDEEGASPSINATGDSVSTTRIHRFLLRREQGRVAEEEDAIRASIEAFPWYPYHRAALACLLVEVDRREEARLVLDDLSRDGFRALIRDCEWLFGLCLAAEACRGLEDASAARVAYDLLLPFAGRHAVAHAEGSVGAVDRYLGVLAGMLGRFDDAERHFVDAVAINDRIGSRPWAAHTRCDHAALLLVRRAPGDEARATALLEAASATADELGMRRLQARVAALRSAMAAPTTVPPSSTRRRAGFHREGEYWVIEFDTVLRLRDSKGLQYLAQLLSHPGREFHALDLAAARRGTTPEIAESQAPAHGLSVRAELTATALDAEARDAYRARIVELRADADEAESFHDPERARVAREELDLLQQELVTAFGLNGRARPSGSQAERARQSVTKAIRESLRRIAAGDRALGDHLDRSIHTGMFCQYDPDPSAAPEWAASARQ